MKKKILMLGIILISTMSLLLALFYMKTKDIKYINSNEINKYGITMLLETEEGQTNITEVPNEGYYKVEYTCDNNSAIISWNNISRKLKIKATTIPVKCTIAFTEVTEDFNIVAMYVNGTELTGSLPNGNYYLDTSTTKCYNGGGTEVSKTVTYDNDTKDIKVSNITEPVYCEVHLISTTELLVKHILDNTELIAQNTETFLGIDGIENSELSGLCKENRTGKTENVCSSTYSSVYSQISNYLGTPENCATYYYRGNVFNNHVVYNGYRWRIVRINEDGSIRLVYQGIESRFPDQGESSKYSGFIAYGLVYSKNGLRDTSSAVGYMYGEPTATNWNEIFADTSNNTIKSSVDIWYLNNLNNNSKYLSKTAIYCSDRSTESSAAGGNVYFGASTRLYQSVVASRNPQFSCPNLERDGFTLSTVNHGNKKLTYPIALLTADEAAYAGALYLTSDGLFRDTVEQTNYLFQYANSSVWTMTPFRFHTSVPTVYLYHHYSGFSTYGAYSVRPVISLKSCVTYAGGDGTINNPYKVGIDSNCTTAIN